MKTTDDPVESTPEGEWFEPWKPRHRWLFDADRYDSWFDQYKWDRSRDVRGELAMREIVIALADLEKEPS